MNVPVRKGFKAFRAGIFLVCTDRGGAGRRQVFGLYHWQGFKNTDLQGAAFLTGKDGFMALGEEKSAGCGREDHPWKGRRRQFPHLPIFCKGVCVH